jgi:predicted RecA/RadA family phage recombinase
MAKAVPRDSVKNLRTLKLAHTAAVEAGEVIVDSGNILVAVNDADADEENIYIYRGRSAFPKASGVSTAIAANTKVYWDEAEGVAKTDDEAAANALIGVTIEAATDDDTEVLVMQQEN